MTTTFAERLRWARYKGPAARKAGKSIGATQLAREAGCAQSLISSLERQNATSSLHNNKFARTLGVDTDWLATGNPAHTPEGFDEKEAKELRNIGGPGLLSIVHSAPKPRGETPRWATDSGKHPPPQSVGPLVTLQKNIMGDFMAFAEAAGAVRATALIELLQHYVRTSILSEEPARKNET